MLKGNSFLNSTQHFALSLETRTPRSDGAPSRICSADARLTFKRYKEHMHKCGESSQTPHKGDTEQSNRAVKHHTSCTKPAPARRKRPESQRSSSTRAATASAHMPTAHRKCACPASRRPTPRRAQKSRAEAQAHPGTRRTFHEPRGAPETDAERACQNRAIQKQGWHPRRTAPAKASKGASTPRKSRSPAQPTSSQARKPCAAARAPPEPVHTHRRSVSLPRPTPRTAALSPRSRAEAQEPHRRAPHLRRAARSL